MTSHTKSLSQESVEVSKECDVHDILVEKELSHRIYVINPQVQHKRYKIIYLPDQNDSFLVYDAERNFVSKCSYETADEAEKEIKKFIDSNRPPQQYIDNDFSNRVSAMVRDACNIPRNVYVSIRDYTEKFNLCAFFRDPTTSFVDSFDRKNFDPRLTIYFYICFFFMMMGGHNLILPLYMLYHLNNFMKTIFDTLLATADVTLERVIEHVDKSSLHCTLKAVTQFSLHLALALVVVSRLILHVVSVLLSPLAFLQSPLKWAQEAVRFFDPFSKRTNRPICIGENAASVWKIRFPPRQLKKDNTTPRQLKKDNTTPRQLKKDNTATNTPLLAA